MDIIINALAVIGAVAVIAAVSLGLFAVYIIVSFARAFR